MWVLQESIRAGCTERVLHSFNLQMRSVVPEWEDWEVESTVRPVRPLVEMAASESLWVRNRAPSDGMLRLRTLLLRPLLVRGLTRAWVCSRSGLWVSAPG